MKGNESNFYNLLLVNFKSLKQIILLIRRLLTTFFCTSVKLKNYKTYFNIFPLYEQETKLLVIYTNKTQWESNF